MTSRKKLFSFVAALVVLIPVLHTQTRSAEAAPSFSLRTSSIKPVTAFVVDPTTNYIYAQENEGKEFFRYDPAANIWLPRASAPLYSGNNGGAAYSNGKIYTVYTQNAELMGVYNIASNKWSTLPNPLGQGTGNITSIGDTLYLANDANFVSYNVVTQSTTSLASPPFSFQEWGGLKPYNGFIYGHEGNGTNNFARYEIATNTWASLPSVPGNGAVLGSAIDPVNGIYYTYGDYEENNLYAYNIAGATWSTISIPYFDVDDGGLAYISTPNYDGIYFVQGEQGMGFAYYGENILFPPGSTYNTSVNGAGILANTNNKVSLSFYGAYNKNGLSGSVSLIDSKTNTKFESTQIQTVVGDGNEATIYGVGKINGVGGYSFRLITEDSFPALLGRGDQVILDVASGTLFYSSYFNPGDVKVVSDPTYNFPAP